MKKYNNKKGIGFIDSGIKIIIAIIIGSLLLVGTYALAKDTVIPTVKSKVESLFDYSGEVSVSDTRITGDINGDGAIDENDLDILTEQLLHRTSDYDDATLDVNGDGAINMKDLLRTKKLIDAQEG